MEGAIDVTVPNIRNAHDPETRNIINRSIDVTNELGKKIQDLVAKGQLTPEQYATLIQTVNGLISKGNVTFDDIDINKGKLLPKHASEELLSMITGNTPINAVPADGSITTIKLADNTVSRKKLDKQFSLNGNIPNGTDLDTLIDEGIYFGQQNGEYINLPSEFATNRLFELKVEPLSSSWAMQTFTDFTNPGSVWKKAVHRINIGNGSKVWRSTAMPLPGTVNREHLGDNFNNYGIIPAGTNLNDIYKPGVYLGSNVGTYLSTPEELSETSFVLNVYTAGAVNSFIVQELTRATNSNGFYRRININPSTPSKWEKHVPSGSLVEGEYFSDKTFLMFGDSITENGNYPELISSYLNADVKKAGFGGCRMAQHTQSGNGLLYDKMCMHKLADYIETGDFSELVQASEDLVRTASDDNRPQAKMLAALDFDTVDYITVFFGTNDYAAGINSSVPMGNNNDANGTTFKGAVNKTITKITSSLPHVKLMFITPFYRDRIITGDGLNSDDSPNEQGYYLQDYVDAIKEVCRIHHIPVLDMMENSGINRYNQAHFLADGLHPSMPKGYEHVARKINSFIQSEF